jgi:transposase
MEPLTAHIDYKALYEQSQLDIMQLRQELDQLKKMIFGTRQERFVANGAAPAQLAMGLESEIVAATP